jgi:hypothetical protein
MPARKHPFVSEVGIPTSDASAHVGIPGFSCMILADKGDVVREEREELIRETYLL